jgi:hypothetical protein
MKHPVLVKKDYTIYFEYVLYNEIQEIIVVHCDITKWNKTVKHQLAVDSFKFITMMGFYPCLDEILIEDGSKNMMFIWSNI